MCTFNSCTDTKFYSGKSNTRSGVELPGIANNRGEERKWVLPATVPKQFSFSLASWKTCSLRLRSLPSAFAMKFQRVESSWAGPKRWPGTRGIVHTSWIHSGVGLGRKEDPTNHTFAVRFCRCPQLRFSFPVCALFILFHFKALSLCFSPRKVALRQEHAEDCYGAVHPGQLPPLQSHPAAVGAGPHVGVRVPGSAQLQRRCPGLCRWGKWICREFSGSEKGCCVTNRCSPWTPISHCHFLSTSCLHRHLLG